MRIWLLVVAGLLLGPRAEAGGGVPADSAEAIFASLERAWAQGDAAGVLAHLGSCSVAITLPGLEPRGGLFSPSQTWFILKQHLQSAKTLQYRFVDTRRAAGGRPVAMGLAERQFREPSAGRVTQDRVLVTLVREGPRWVIASITAL